MITTTGSTQYLEHASPTGLVGAASFTMAYWLVPPGVWTNTGSILGGINAGSTYWRSIYYPASFQIILQDIIGAAYAYPTSTTALAASTPAHIAWVFDGALGAGADLRMKLFINGASIPTTLSGAFGATFAVTATKIWFGHETASGTGATNIFGHFKVWSTTSGSSAALSQDEVVREMYSYLPVRRDSTLTMWCPFDVGDNRDVDYVTGVVGTQTGTVANADDVSHVHYGDTVVLNRAPYGPTRRSMSRSADGGAAGKGRRGGKRLQISGNAGNIAPHIPLYVSGV